MRIWFVKIWWEWKWKKMGWIEGGVVKRGWRCVNGIGIGMRVVRKIGMRKGGGSLLRKKMEVRRRGIMGRKGEGEVIWGNEMKVGWLLRMIGGLWKGIKGMKKGIGGGMGLGRVKGRGCRIL